MKKVADKEELLCVLDENGNKTGKMELRSVVHENQLLHNEVSLWVIDKENKRVLLERRSKYKKHNPSKLSIVAGHVVGDETFEDAIKKEALEEIGLDISKLEVKKLGDFHFVHHFLLNNPINHMYYCLATPKLSELKRQEEEVDEILWFDYEKFKALAKEENPETVFLFDEPHRVMFSLLDKVIYDE